MSNATILPSSLDYTDKDFASIRLRLQALIRSVFPTWTDFNVANFGDLLLELNAFVGDILTYYQDNQARESRLVTATQLKNVIALAQMIGYAPQGAEAAQTEETLTLATPPTGTVTIPAGTKILTANITGPVAFQLLADAFFAAHLNPPTVNVLVENSSNQSDTFTSNGLPNQTFILSQTPFLDTSNGTPITVFTAADGTYTQVDNFLNSGPTDKHFIVSIDQNGRATITTGDGINGSIPSGGITIDYRTGGGASGNVDPGTISRVQGSFVDSLGNPVNVSATNVSKAQGGLDPQTVPQIQVAAPAGLRSNTRSVTIDDFETNALRVPGAARALMVTSNQDPAVPENTGDLFIVPVGGGVAGTALLAAVKTMVTVTYPSTLTFKVNTFSARYLSVDVFIRFYKQKGFTGAQVGANLRATLSTFFQVQNPDGTPNENVDFGANLTDTNGNPAPFIEINALLVLCQKTTGVREIGGNPPDFLLNSAHADAALTPEQFPELGNVTLIDGDTGLVV